MFTTAKKATLALALAASALATATPAMANPYYGNRHHNRGGDTAGAAIVGGIIGIALGAIIASSSNNNRDRTYTDRRYDPRYRGQPTWNGQVYNNGYNNQYNNPYDNRYQGSYQQGTSRDGYSQGNDGYYDRRGYGEGQYDGRNEEYRGN